jgi:hypothetical protein
MDLKQGGRCPNPQECGWKDQTDTRFFPQLAPHTLLDSRYVLGRVLGQGGFGITYIAAELGEYRKLAIKEYFPSSFATRTADRRTVVYAGPGNREPYQYGLKKFEEEAETLQRFQNYPSIVSVLRSFKANGTAYIVMEYLEGTTLLSHLGRQPGGVIPFADALQIFTPIMDALRETHRARMIHRDVSPDNVFLCRSGRIKLLDFGAARVAFGDQTQSQQLILKPGYTPEEQYRSTGVAGPYTDVYSLGATIYRSITGQPPPEAPERLSDDRMKPPSHYTVLPSRADKALMKALAVRAKDRYQSIDDFQADVRGISIQKPKPRPLPGTRLVNAFTAWWTVASALMLAGSALRRDDPTWLFWVGLIPAFIGLAYMAPVIRSGGGRSVVFVMFALFSVVLTGATPYGAVLLVAPVFAAQLTGRPANVPRPARAQFALRCMNGDLAGTVLELGAASIVIGRVPDQSNVVIPMPQISGKHARVWVDGSLWIEDLDSRNGTFLKRSGAVGWTKISGRQQLAKGDRFYLCGEELATFVVESLD